MAIDWNQEVEVICVAATMNHYRGKGYSVPKQLEKFTVIANDLPLSSSCKIQVICDDCGRVNKITASKHSDRHTDYMCHACAVKNKSSVKRIIPTDAMVNDFQSKTGLIVTSTEGLGTKLKITFIASCGHEKIMVYRSFTRRGVNCLCDHCFKQSVAEKYRFTIDKVREIFIDGGCELLSNTYINNRTLLKYKCQCGNISMIKLDKFQKGDRCGCLIPTGENHPNFNPSLTNDERQIQRNFPEYREWRTKVYESHNYTCQCCGEQGGTLNAHHIQGYSEFPDLRTEVSNGITLCNDCHTAFHQVYSKKGNNQEQLTEFIECNAHLRTA